MTSAENGAEAFALGRAVDLGLKNAHSQPQANIREILGQLDESDCIDPALVTVLSKEDIEAVHLSHNDGRGGYDNTERLVANAIAERPYMTKNPDCGVTGADTLESSDDKRDFVILTLDEKGVQTVRSARGIILGYFNLERLPTARTPFVRVGMAEPGYASYVAKSIGGLLANKPIQVKLTSEYYFEPSEEI